MIFLWYGQIPSYGGQRGNLSILDKLPHLFILSSKSAIDLKKWISDLGGKMRKIFSSFKNFPNIGIEIKLKEGKRSRRVNQRRRALLKDVLHFNSKK